MAGMSIRIEDEIRQNELLTVKEVAAYLRVSRVTVWRWCQQGTISASRVGRNWRIRRDDLLELLGTTQCPPPPSSNQHDGSNSGDDASALILPTIVSEQGTTLQFSEMDSKEASVSDNQQTS